MNIEQLVGTSIGISTLIAIGVIAITFLIMFVVFRSVFSVIEQRQKLLQTRITAQAKILRMWDTGVTVNENPQVGLVLEVMPEEYPTYQTEVKSIISRLYIPQIQPGMTVPIRYNPANPQTIALAF